MSTLTAEQLAAIKAKVAALGVSSIKPSAQQQQQQQQQQPSAQPSIKPSAQPSIKPSAQPSAQPQAVALQASALANAAGKNGLQAALQRMVERKAASATPSAAKQALDIAMARQDVARKELARAVEAGTSTAASFQWNAEQLRAIELATSAEGDKGFALVGAAGTGKTTVVREVISSLLSNYVDNGIDPTGKVALVAFTNRATRNIKRSIKALPDGEVRLQALKACSTIHKLLGFMPHFYDVDVTETDAKGNTSIVQERTMRFEPTYNWLNPKKGVELIVIDEASMVPINLFKLMVEAFPNARFIFIGDLNQLKPVGFLSILGFKLAELPVVELTKVYRQAMSSQIVAFQHNYTLEGKKPSQHALQTLSDKGTALRAEAAAQAVQASGTLELIPLTQARDGEAMCRVWARTLMKRHEAGEYLPGRDVALLPNNPAEYFGTVGVNLWLAQFFGELRNAIVHEVFAGPPSLSHNKLYLAEGDFVTYDREEWFIRHITPNPKYAGPSPRQPDVNLMRTGVVKGAGGAKHLEEDDVDFEDLLEQGAPDTERKLAGSHIVTLVPAGTATNLEEALMQLGNADDTALAEVKVSSKGELKSIAFGYCLSVHKSQGSEWRHVFMCVTSHHTATVSSRELLYTGMTRARERLVLWYSPDSGHLSQDNSLAKAIGRCSFPGKSWKEKLPYFNQKREEYEAFMAVPTEFGVVNGKRRDLAETDVDFLSLLGQ